MRKTQTAMLIQPTSELDRRTVPPVPTVVAYRAIEAGEISGLAAWCGCLEWETSLLFVDGIRPTARNVGQASSFC